MFGVDGSVVSHHNPQDACNSHGRCHGVLSKDRDVACAGAYEANHSGYHDACRLRACRGWCQAVGGVIKGCDWMEKRDKEGPPDKRGRDRRGKVEGNAEVAVKDTEWLRVAS